MALMSSLLHANEGAGKANRRSATSSDVALTGKEARWSFAMGKGKGKGHRPWKSRQEGRVDPSSANANMNAIPAPLSPFVDPVELQHLCKYTSKIRNAAKNIHHVDSAWEEYIKHREKCLECAKTLLKVPTESGFRPSDDTLSLTPTDTDATLGEETCRDAVREWESAVEHLENTLRLSLQETYNAYDKDATPEGFERLCTDKNIRHETIYQMRNASISKTMSATLDFFPRYDVRFRNYDEIKKDLTRLRALLGPRPPIPHERTVIERRISPTGDAILEFANKDCERAPVFRFRVASHCLRETSSPIFGHVFNARFRADLDDELRQALPAPPARYVCSDGSEVLLYRMPQTELNTERSFEILLHAAHNHTDRVPRAVQFTQFVAIAEACLRYRCTSPLEMAVEHLWLPYWRRKARWDMLEGALLISFVFGLAENFRRLSRLAILNGTEACRPGLVREKIDAVRREKLDQVSLHCKTALNEYLDRAGPSQQNGPRCHRGDYACDGQNLGWLMRQLAEIGMLSTAGPTLPAFLNIQAPNNRSLLELTDALCQITSPSNCHCDFAPAFRAAVTEIYNGVTGLTLHDVSGKRGWALSKNRHSGIEQQEILFELATRERPVPDQESNRLSATTLLDEGDADDACYLKILEYLDDPRDLRAAALVNRRFYRCYLRNETKLLGMLGMAGEKFRYGVEDKRLVERDGNKYAGDARERCVLFERGREVR